MIVFILLLCLSTQIFAASSELIPLFGQAAEIYSSETSLKDSHVLRKELVLILKAFQKHQVSSTFVRRFAHLAQRQDFPLTISAREVFWPKQRSKENVPEVSFQVIKIKVVEESDDALNDDLYMYFLMTDGVVPTGKVTALYRGIDEGETFFFNQVDRILYPLNGGAKSPDGHLIIDYGIMESDGDDIGELQKVSASILDLAGMLYASQSPEDGPLVSNLRQEVKALMGLVLSLNHDDRLVTGTMAFKGSELSGILGESTVVDFVKKHRKSSPFDDFKYEIQYRLIKK